MSRYTLEACYDKEIVISTDNEAEGGILVSIVIGDMFYVAGIDVGDVPILVTMLQRAASAVFERKWDEGGEKRAP